MPGRIVRAARLFVGALLAVGAAALLYFAAWLGWTEVLPQIRASGFSLAGSNMILNRDWRGNQLYLLIGLYALAGFGLAAAAIRLWRRR